VSTTPEADQNVTKLAAQAVRSAQVTTRTIVRVVAVALLILCGLALALWMLYKLTGVILLVVLAIFFAYLIAPLVDLVRRPFGFNGTSHRMPRGPAIGIVYLVIFGTIVLSIYIATPILNEQFTELSEQAPTYTNAVKERTSRYWEAYKNRFPQSVRDSINKNVIEKVGPLGESALPALGGLLLTVLGYLPWLVLIPIITFFILKDVEVFRVTALRMFPSGRWRWRADDFFQDINKTLAAYTRAQLIACFLIGTICAIGFWLIGLPYVLLLAVLAGCCEFVPLVGPLIVAIIVTTIAGYYSFKQAVATLLFLLVLRIVHDYVTYPRIIGRGIHLHPLAVVLAILAGAELGGVPGIFLAIPVVALVSVAHENWVEYRGTGLVAELLQPDATDAPPMTAPPLPKPTVTFETPGDGLDEWTTQFAAPAEEYPSVTTTVEDMARHRPDLTTGELKLPDED
jgi:predicted PurR-regulated permease PerM